DRPPTRSRIPANKSLKALAPMIASPVTIPRYSVICLPSILGVVVMIIFSGFIFLKLLPKYTIFLFLICPDKLPSQNKQLHIYWNQSNRNGPKYPHTKKIQSLPFVDPIRKFGRS